jgi:hypothetical protein
MDVHADILPGVGAAGIALGARIEDVLDSIDGEIVSEDFTDCRRDRAGCVGIWSRGGHVDQVCVERGYQGTLFGWIRVGTILREIHERIGRIQEDEADCLAIEGVYGVCFETGWSAGHLLREPVKVICVFPGDRGERRYDLDLD